MIIHIQKLIEYALSISSESQSFQGNSIEMKQICTNKIGKLFPKMIALVIMIFLSGCGMNWKEIPTRISILLSPTPSLSVLPSSLPVRTLTLKSVLPTPLSTPTPSIAMSALKTPVTLDPIHWKLFTIPVNVLLSDTQHIGQAGDGTMWFGGREIYRFDGKNWLIYDQDNISSFRGKVVESLAVESGGTVWLGTEMNEIVSFDGRVWSSQTVEEGGYRDNDIVSILIRKNGQLCAISIESLSCMSEGKWTRHPIIIKYEVNHPVYIREPVLTSSDEIWIPLSNGVLYHYDGINWESKKISKWIDAISPGKNGSLWIFDADGFGKRDLHGKIVYKTIPGVVWEHNPFVMKEAEDGTVWFGTGAGYQVARYKNGVFETIDGRIISNSKKIDFDSENFPFYHVHCIFQAKDGSMWFGTVGGIFHYQ